MAPLIAPLAGFLESFTEPQFAAWFSAAFAVASLLLFLGLVGSARWRGRTSAPDKAAAEKAHPGAHLSAAFWMTGLVLALASAATFNVIVDPYGMYGSGILAPVKMQMRRLKAEAYAALPDVPQVVVLGSSIAHSISPGTLRRELGLTAFNAAVGSGRIEDFLIQARFMHSVRGGVMPPVFFVQLSPTLRFDSNRTADITPLSMLPFMPPRVALMALRQRVSRSIDRGQTGDSLYVLLAHSATSRRVPAREIDRYGETFGMMAARTKPPQPPQHLERRLSRFIARAKPPARTRPCRELDPRALGALDDFLRLTTGSGSSVVFYLSPTHPRYRREVLDHSAPFQHCRGLLIAHLRAQSTANGTVDFLDLSRLDSIHGDPSSAGYTDPFHLTPANGDRLIARAAPTLRAAAARAAAGTPRPGRR